MKQLNRKQLNFLPKELQPSSVNFHNFQIIFLIATLVIPGIGAGLKFAILQTERTVAELEAQRNLAQSNLANQLRTREENPDARVVRSVRSAMAERVFWAEIFKELSGLSPQGIWLTDLETKLEEKNRTILISGEAQSQEDVAKFLENLEKSFYFRDLRLAYTELATADRRNFVRFQFKGSIYEEKGLEHAQN
jgi:Tfp pilus assembly protein PilN